jgi:cyclophilin family peptidyl-prolyl cis-trans isomerase
MAVLLDTSKGQLVIDLYTEDCPTACKNFLKLCKCAAACHVSPMTPILRLPSFLF